MSRFDIYNHLNSDKRDGVVVGIEPIAEQVVLLNYGFHRILCALVRAQLKRFPDSELAHAVKEVLDRGYTI